MDKKEIYYTKDHEWVSIKGDSAIVGITPFATKELGEIVFIELPESGAKFKQKDEIGTLESVKSVSSLYLPLTGTIASVNENAKLEPSLLNESPYKEGWLVKIKGFNRSEFKSLLSESEYQKLINSV